METLIISIAAGVASALTLFSGFGLGTLLMPVIAIFFPIDVAITITAIVHLANNLFKLALLGKQANQKVLISFGLPAVVFAFLGALLLSYFTITPPLITYTLFNMLLHVTLIKLVIGLVIITFIILELTPALANMTFEQQYLPYGGIISGFFGGLSGHQGAFRSMFLIKAGLSKTEFIATGVTLAVMVDISRLMVYGWDISTKTQNIEWTLVIAASTSALIGAYFATKYLEKITIKTIRMVVSGLLTSIALGLILGLI
jgi:uncharacterized protein